MATCPSCSLIVRVIYDMVRLRRSAFPHATGERRSNTVARNRWITRTATQRNRQSTREVTAVESSDPLPCPLCWSGARLEGRKESGRAACFSA